MFSHRQQRRRSYVCTRYVLFIRWYCSVFRDAARSLRNPDSQTTRSNQFCHKKKKEKKYNICIRPRGPSYKSFCAYKVVAWQCENCSEQVFFFFFSYAVAHDAIRVHTRISPYTFLFHSSRLRPWTLVVLHGRDTARAIDDIRYRRGGGRGGAGKTPAKWHARRICIRRPRPRRAIYCIVRYVCARTSRGIRPPPLCIMTTTAAARWRRRKEKTNGARWSEKRHYAEKTGRPHVCLVMVN